MQIQTRLILIPLISMLAISSAREPAGQASSKSAEVSDNVATVEGAPSNYMLGPDDQITLYISDAEEISGKPMRIDMKGDVNLPLAGRIHAAGLTAEQLEAAIQHNLKKFFENPEVVVSITEFRSQPISVLGAVNAPGVHQLQGRKNLFEVISMAGGLRADAGNSVRITRNLKWGPIPLPNANNDSTGQFSVGSVNTKDIMNASSPTQNIAVKPEDVISVPKANVVYVMGSVHKPGGFELGENESLSTLQVLSLAEGLDHAAAPQNAKIMRTVPGNTSRAEIRVDLRKLMAGKAADPPLQADDILFVPNSSSKSAATRALEAALQIGTGMAIYSRP